MHLALLDVLVHICKWTEIHTRITTTMYFVPNLMLSILTVTALGNIVLSTPVDGADQDAGGGGSITSSARASVSSESVVVSRITEGGDKEAKFPNDWSTPGDARFFVEAPTQAAEAEPTGQADKQAKFPNDWSTPGDARFFAEAPTQAAEAEPTGQADKQAKFPNDWSTPGNARFFAEAPTQAAEAEPTGQADKQAKFPNDWSTPGDARFFVETPTQAA